MKHFVTFILLLAVIALVAPMRLLAATQVVDGVEWSYSLSDGNATVTGANPATGDLVIPATLGGSPVTSIRYRAFYNCSELTSIVIPNSVTFIGNSAFVNCSGLTSVVIPYGVTSIGSSAFSGSGLTTITIPNSVTSIGSDAFYYCNGLTSVNIPNSVTSLGSEAFGNCRSLTFVEIPDTVVNAGDCLFLGCSSLNELRINIYDMTRWVTNSINSLRVLDPSVQEHRRRRLFFGDVEMFEAVIPDGVTVIGNDAFLHCSDLMSITIPNSVTNIGSNAFSGCTNAVILLKTDSLPSDVLAAAALDQVRGVYCHRSARAAVIAAAGFEKLFGCLDENENPTIFQAEILSTTIRDNDPNVMDVDYVVHSDSPTVNVRALAFKNGERGFATILRPKTFIDGTGANIGDGIAANIGHRLSWRIPSDWNTDYGMVSFEVLAMEPGTPFLPMHFVMIPAAEGHPKTIVSVNDLSRDAYEITRDSSSHSGIYQKWWGASSRVVGHDPLLNSLLWLYASGEGDLSLTDGELTSGLIGLVRHAGFLQNEVFYGLHDNPRYTILGNWSLNPNAFRYVFGKMGYRLLEDEDELAWINENTRLDLQPQQFRQYAVKTVEE